MRSKQYFTKIKNYPHEKSTDPKNLSENTAKTLSGFLPFHPQTTFSDFISFQKTVSAIRLEETGCTLLPVQETGYHLPLSFRQ